MNPTLLTDLIFTQDLAAELLICPGTEDEAGGCSYIYRGADLNSSAGAEMILAYDKMNIHGAVRNVLFADGTVKTLSEEEFAQVIGRDNELRSQQGLTKKPVGK